MNPTPKTIIVIGGVAGGASCAARQRRLDMRRADERAKGFIPGSMHIPLDELRARNLAGSWRTFSTATR